MWNLLKVVYIQITKTKRKYNNIQPQTPSINITNFQSIPVESRNKSMWRILYQKRCQIFRCSSQGLWLLPGNERKISIITKKENFLPSLLTTKGLTLCMIALKVVPNQHAIFLLISFLIIANLSWCFSTDLHFSSLINYEDNLHPHYSFSTYQWEYSTCIINASIAKDQLVFLSF